MKGFIGKTDIPGWLIMVSPYDKSFVEQFKSAVPSGQRRWEPESKRWLFNSVYIADVVGLLKLHFPEIEITSDLVQEVEPETSLFEQLLAILPDDYLEKIYKILAMALHPDRGGSNELMSKLNQAYAKRRKKT